MLARTYLTARKLGISEPEREALINVLEGLEGGWFVHTEPHAIEEDDYRIGLAFSMASWCGTTSCIAGWADTLYHTDFIGRFRDEWTNRRGRRKNLQDLFHIDGPRALDRIPFDTTDIGTKQAAQALRNYLATGKPHWDLILEQVLGA